MDDKLFDLINKQVTHEHHAAMVYTQLAYELDDMSLPGMRDWMYAQAEEEREHAQKFVDHLLDRGRKPQIGQVGVDELAVETPKDAFELALNHEKKVSEQIRTITRTADSLDDLESRTLLNWFLDEQIEEEATVGEIIDQLEMVGSNGEGILRIDGRLAQRGENN